MQNQARNFSVFLNNAKRIKKRRKTKKGELMGIVSINFTGKADNNPVMGIVCVLLCIHSAPFYRTLKIGKLTDQELQVREGDSPLPGCDAASPVLCPVLEPLVGERQAGESPLECH